MSIEHEFNTKNKNRTCEPKEMKAHPVNDLESRREDCLVRTLGFLKRNPVTSKEESIEQIHCFFWFSLAGISFGVKSGVLVVKHNKNPFGVGSCCRLHSNRWEKHTSHYGRVLGFLLSFKKN